MAVTIPVIPRQNSTANNPPTTTAVKVGELAVNVVDGTLWTNYTPAGAGTTQTILQLGGKGFLTTAVAATTYAPIASPTFTGTATIPTATISGGTINSASIGTTSASTGSFTTLNASGASTLAGLTSTGINSSPIGSTTASTGAFTNLSATGTTTLASPSLTGTPTAPTATTGTNTTQVATTAFVNSAGYLTSSSAASTYAPIASPTITGIASFTSSIAIGSSTTSSAVSLTLDTTSAVNRQIFWQTGGNNRWGWATDTSSESGSNAGCNFYLSNYADNGSFLSNAIGVVRSTGNVNISLVSIYSGTIDNTVIGGATPSSAIHTTLTANSTLTASSAIVRPIATYAAAGTNFSTATALSSFFNEVTSGTGGVVLPTVSTGLNLTGTECYILNRSGAPLTVYPDTSSNTIESGSAGAGVVVPNLADARFTKVSSTNWLSTGGDNGYYTALNASSIGAQTAGTGAFTTLTASTSLSGAGVVAAHAAPGPIGNTTPSTGAFTTLSSSGLSTLSSLTVSTTSTFTGIQTLTVAPVLTSTTASTVLSSNASKQLVSTTLSNGLVAGSGTLTFNVATMFPPINATITATTYTLATTDNNSTKVFNPTAACVITVPSTLTAGFTCNVWNKSNYKITWTPASGVTIAVYPSTATGTAGQNAVMTFYCDTSTDWVVGGAVS